MLRLVCAEEVLPVERLVVLPVERFVRSVWGATERLVVAAEELPVLRLVCAEEVLPVERLVVEPVERLVVLLPVERFVRSV